MEVGKAILTIFIIKPTQPRVSGVVLAYASWIGRYQGLVGQLPE